MFVPSRFEAAAWYDDLLGLKIVAAYKSWADNPNGPLMISGDGGKTKLALFRGQPPGNRTTAGFHQVAFSLEGPAYLEFLRRLEDLDLKNPAGQRVSPDMVVDHGRSFSIYFSDPYGHRLEITTYEYDLVIGEISQ